MICTTCGKVKVFCGVCHVYYCCFCAECPIGECRKKQEESRRLKAQRGGGTGSNGGADSGTGGVM